MQLVKHVCDCIGRFGQHCLRRSCMTCNLQGFFVSQFHPAAGPYNDLALFQCIWVDLLLAPGTRKNNVHDMVVS